MSQLLYGANVNANGIRQHYLRYGGKGQPLVLIPGITSPAITWGFVAEVLGNHFDVYVLDVRGRGLSQTGPELDYGTDACTDDVIEFIKVLGLQDVVLAGHSMGARFAARAFTRGVTNVSRVVLIDPPVSGPGRRAYPSKLPWYVDSIADCEKGADLETMRKYCPTWTDEQLYLRAEWLHTCYAPGIIKAFNDFHDDDFHADLPNIDQPVILMVAGKGGVIQPDDEKEISSLIPQLEIVHVENAGHMIPWDDCPDFFKVLGKALSVDFSS